MGRHRAGLGTLLTAQLSFEVATALCDYGLPKLGEARPCSKVATHRACWLIPPAYRDGVVNTRAGAGSIVGCLDHANYYARGWLGPVLLYPYVCDAVWMEVLPQP